MFHLIYLFHYPWKAPKGERIIKVPYYYITLWGSMYRSTSSALMYFPRTSMGFPPKKVYLVRPILLECLKLFPTWCKESFICLLRHWRGISIFTWYWCAALKQKKEKQNSVSYELPAVLKDCERSLFFSRFSEGSARVRERQAMRREKRGRQPLPPSVTRVNIFVSRAFRWTD